ncbi:serine/arginine-rich splicing factor SC35-like [Arachis ipaensis]|uniref:serine/arginine-rich splicing factor SC35-like n=1 Tax=Arachis ipaensis TaxID=130454 RepID=UPI0007AFDF60|nr:serine/arginine-rich splicing factor SC35-like [Arachis ipaensis]XP_025669923.1 serine/arginine-rich splicing factor SC35-like [Arachis hypogaea]
MRERGRNTGWVNTGTDSNREKHGLISPKRELFSLFNWTDRIIDIYLARKNKNGQIYLFAFIRYTTKGGALKAIAKINHMVLRGKRMFVAEAKYRRKHELKDVKGKEVEEPARKEQEGGPQQHKIARKMEEHVDNFARDAQGKDPNKNG